MYHPPRELGALLVHHLTSCAEYESLLYNTTSDTEDSWSVQLLDIDYSAFRRYPLHFEMHQRSCETYQAWTFNPPDPALQ